MPGNILGVNGVSADILNLASVTSTTSQQKPIDSGTVEKNAKVDGAAGEQIPIIGTSSLFNPFYIFRYSEFGAGANANTTGNYNLSGHKMTYDSSKALIQLNASAIREQRKEKMVVQNPSAVNIQQWANKQAEFASNHKGPLYPYPYALQDFTQCKWYGKIPNNRLLTLRRYPMPIEDNLQVSSDKLPLIPIAQAVTWWGGDTGNTLSKILGMTWSFNWKLYPGEGQPDIQDVQGNEIKLESLLDAAGIKNETARQALIASFGSMEGGNPFTMSGYDKTLQDNLKKQFEDGSYANRVRGPLNVIDQTYIRDRGYVFKNEIVLSFEYRLRAVGTSGLNPKIVMLDLISNFLSLTYNRASFWGGGYRYFQQTGPLLPGFNTDSMEKGDYADASKQLMSMLSQMVQAGGSDLKEFLNNVGNTAKGGDGVAEKMKNIVGEFAGSRVGQNLIASRLGNLHQTPLVMRALTDGRAVGEWHLMVGNPMDPVAAIGNLILKSTQIEFSDELGADDFPTEVKFTVTLDHGRPRAKQDIESMFNHGGGDMYFTALEPPASTRNSYGEYNSRRILDSTGTLPTSTGLEAASAQATATSSQNVNTSMTRAKETSKYFEPSVSAMYGSGFGASKILPDYFLKLYTVD